MRKTTKRRIVRFWGWLRPILVVVVVFSAFRSSVADWNDVPTGSMKPSIVEGDRIFVNKLAYDLKVPFTDWRMAQWSQPNRGDVVVFWNPADGRRFVKRVIGLAGETIKLRDNRLFINGQPARYEPLEPPVSNIDRPDAPQRRFAKEIFGKMAHPVAFTPSVPSRRNFGPVTVPAGYLFLMGDNRDNSADSRFFGPVPYRNIVGRAVGVVFSLDRDDYYLPRKDRFLRGVP